MFRRVLSALITGLVVSVALVNLNGRWLDEPEPIEPCTITACDPFAQTNDFIRQYLIMGEVNQQNQPFLRVLPVFHHFGTSQEVITSRSLSEIYSCNFPEKHTVHHLLEFCCRLNI